MLRLKEKENLFLNHLGIYAVFSHSKKVFNLVFVSEGFTRLIESQTYSNQNKFINKSLHHLCSNEIISYIPFGHLARSLNKVLEEEKTNILENGKDFPSSKIDFGFQGDNLHEGFNIINSLFYDEHKSKQYIIHRLVPKDYVTPQKLISEKKQILKQISIQEFFKSKYFSKANKPIAIVDLEGELFECNELFQEKLIQEDAKGKFKLNQLAVSPEDRLLLYKTLKETVHHNNAKLKIKLYPDVFYDMSFSLVLGISNKPLVSILFEESTYVSILEKKSTEKGYFIETIGIIHNLFTKNFEPKKLLNEGMQYINAIIEPEITQSYSFDEKNNAYTLLLEQSSREYIVRILDQKHSFNDLVEALMEKSNPMQPKLIHSDTIKNSQLKNLLYMADLKSLLIIPTIKMENRVAISFFGFMERKSNIDLEKIGHYSFLVNQLLHEINYRMPEEVFLSNK